LNTLIANNATLGLVFGNSGSIGVAYAIHVNSVVISMRKEQEKKDKKLKKEQLKVWCAHKNCPKQ